MVIPKDISFKKWWNSLVIDFPNDNIPVLTDEKDWKRLGAFLIQELDFAIQDAPSPTSYDDKFEWAMAIYRSMNNF